MSYDQEQTHLSSDSISAANRVKSIEVSQKKTIKTVTGIAREVRDLKVIVNGIRATSLTLASTQNKRGDTIESRVGYVEKKLTALEKSLVTRISLVEHGLSSVRFKLLCFLLGVQALMLGMIAASLIWSTFFQQGG